MIQRLQFSFISRFQQERTEHKRVQGWEQRGGVVKTRRVLILIMLNAFN